MLECLPMASHSSRVYCLLLRPGVHPGLHSLNFNGLNRKLLGGKFTNSILYVLPNFRVELLNGLAYKKRWKIRTKHLLNLLHIVPSKAVQFNITY